MLLGPSCFAQRISGGFNLFLPARYDSKGYEISLTVNKPYSALTGTLSYGCIRHYKVPNGDLSANFFSTSVLVHDNNYEERDINYFIGLVSTYSRQHDIYYYSYGRNEFNKLTIDQKNIGYWGMGVTAGARILENRAIWFDFRGSLQFASLLHGPDKVVNHIIFGMGSQSKKNLTEFESQRVRFQVNIHVKLFDNHKGEQDN